MTIPEAIQIAREYEKDGIRLPWAADLGKKTLLATAFRGQTKKFFQTLLLRLGTDGNFHLVFHRMSLLDRLAGRNPERRKKRLNEWLNRIGEIKAQLNQAVNRFESYTFSLEACSEYPETSAVLRHEILGLKKLIDARIEPLEQKIRRLMEKEKK